MEVQDPFGFGPNLKRFYNNKDLSDAIIRCGDSEFAVHKLVLFSHSKYFIKQLSGPWKESIEGVIDIADFDISLVEATVHFMYHLDYDVPSEQSVMAFHATVYQIADKYDVQSLKKHACTKFSAAVVKLEGCDKDEFANVIDLVWNTTPPNDRGLMDVVATTSHKNLAALMEKESFIDELTTNGPFAVEVIRLQRKGLGGIHRYHRGFGSVRRYHCHKCKYTFDFGNKKSLSEDASSLLVFGPTYCPMCRESGVQKVQLIEGDEKARSPMLDRL